MDNKRKRLYLLAVYLIIAISAFSLMVLGFDPETDSLKDIAFNLSTELIAVAIVFFLVDFLFSVGDWNLSERVSDLLEHLRRERPPVEKFFEPAPNLEEYIQTANKIDLCGVTLTSTLNKRFSSLRQKLLEGVDIRLLIIRPNTETLWMAARRSEDNESITYYRKRLDATLNDVEYLHKYLTEYREANETPVGNFSVRLMSYAPSFGLASFNAGSKNGCMFVEIYPHHAGYGSPPGFWVSYKADQTWFRYFQEQFEEMWANATLWTPGMTIEQSEPELTVNFVPTQVGTFTNLMKKLVKLISEAQEELLVLDYNPLEPDKPKVRYRDEDKLSVERKEYYKTIINKILEHNGSFHYQRILQIPEKRDITDVVADDPLFREHCIYLAEFGDKRPEIANLKTCPLLHEGSFLIIDRRHLILSMSLLDLEDGYFTGGGYFFFTDWSGDTVKHFLSFFERANAISSLVKSADLKTNADIAE